MSVDVWYACECGWYVPASDVSLVTGHQDYCSGVLEPTDPPDYEMEEISYRDLVDNQMFSADGGETWYRCCTPLFGNVAVYTTRFGGGDAPTMRVVVPEKVLIYSSEEF